MPGHFTGVLGYFTSELKWHRIAKQCFGKWKKCPHQKVLLEKKTVRAEQKDEDLEWLWSLQISCFGIFFRFGIVLLITYFIFMILAILYELNKFGYVHPPECPSDA